MRTTEIPGPHFSPLWQVLEDNGIVAGSPPAAKPSPAPLTPSPVDFAEPDCEAGHDDDELSGQQTEPDASSGYAEPALEEDQAPSFSLTPLDAPLILAPYS